jgi:3-dehydroquinate synthase
MIKQRLKIGFSYDIHFTHGLFSLGNKVLKSILKDKASKILFFLDSGVDKTLPDLKHQIKRWFKAHNEFKNAVFPINLVPGGERCKSGIRYFKNIADILRADRVDRHSCVIIIGGGAVLDSVGFVASITHRGIRHIRIPTTVLSQADSGVGVKNGINFYGTKNYFGTFTPPYAVINDLNFIKTLPRRDRLSGISEAFKVAVIKDKIFLNYLIENTDKLRSLNETVMVKLITRCAAIHAAHISTTDDPFETGPFRPLDFGHWSAHRLETMSGYRINHGEAVAIGIFLDLIIARNLGFIGKSEFRTVSTALCECGFKLWHPLLEKTDRAGRLVIFEGLEEFRQHIGGKLTLIMPKHLGANRQVNRLPYFEVKKAVFELKSFSNK